MATGGKKKMKGKSMNLSEFLGTSENVVSAKKIDWAAEMENVDDDTGNMAYGQTFSFDRSALPKAPKSTRGPDVDMSKVPTQPPFTAFIGNLPYESCEDRIESFFAKQKFLNCRLPAENGRLRGFGYVEFEDRESLLEALTMNDSMFAGRKIRIDLAGQNQNNQGGVGESSRDRGPDRTDSDWRRPGPDESSQDDRGGSGQESHFGDRDGGRFGDRDGGRYGDRDGGRFGERDGGRYGDRDSGGRYGNRDGGRYGDREGGSRYGDRYGSRDGDRDGGGYGSRDGGSRYGDRDGGSRYGDRYGSRDGDRYGSRDGGGRYGSSHDEPRESSQEAPKERKKLQLAPRSKPNEEDRSATNSSVNESTTARSSSIFGNAKPVDTASKEREIGERLHAEPKSVENSTPKEKKPSIFGDAKPVNTAAREREIEERLRKQHEPIKILRDDTERNYDRPSEDYNDTDRLAENETEPSNRTRRNSEENKRERHLSNSSSGKGSVQGHNSGSNRTRKDSDMSNHSSEPADDTCSPTSQKHEDKIIPAPPPKENAWTKRKPEIMSPPSQPQVTPPKPIENSCSKTKSVGKDARQDKPRHDHDYRDRRDDHPRDRPSAPQAKYDGRNKENTKPKKEKPIPKSIDEMPKYNKVETKDWSDKNKFALISSSKDDDDEDEQDAEEGNVEEKQEEETVTNEA